MVDFSDLDRLQSNSNALSCRSEAWVARLRNFHLLSMDQFEGHNSGSGMIPVPHKPTL